MSVQLEGFDGALIGALIGAAALVTSGLLIESYKYSRNRRAAASAIAGEIFAILDMIAKRGQVVSLQTIASILKSGKPFDIPNIVGSGVEGKLDPVIEAHLEHLGFLADDDLPEKIVQFYTVLKGIRVDLVNLSEGVFDKDLGKKAGIIEEGLIIWDVNQKLGHSLHAQLKQIAKTHWWPAASFVGLTKWIKQKYQQN